MVDKLNMVNISGKAQPSLPLLHTMKRWLEPKQYLAVQVAEWVTIDRFLCGLPPAESLAIGMRAPQMPATLVDTLECALAALEISQPSTQGGAHRPPRHQYTPVWNNPEL